MAEYQNIFTQTQVQGPPEMGMVEDVDLRERSNGASFSSLFGMVRQCTAWPLLLRRFRHGILGFGPDLVHHGGCQLLGAGGVQPSCVSCATSSTFH